MKKLFLPIFILLSPLTQTAANNLENNALQVEDRTDLKTIATQEKAAIPELKNPNSNYLLRVHAARPHPNPHIRMMIRYEVIYIRLANLKPKDEKESINLESVITEISNTRPSEINSRTIIDLRGCSQEDENACNKILYALFGTEYTQQKTNPSQVPVKYYWPRWGLRGIQVLVDKTATQSPSLLINGLCLCLGDNRINVTNCSELPIMQSEAMLKENFFGSDRHPRLILWSLNLALTLEEANQEIIKND